MRGLVTRTVVVASVLGCAGPPTGDDPDPAASRETSAASSSAVEGPVEAEATQPTDDPLLARAREQMRGGQIAPELRERLLASREPDHRHAARLLQAVAGEEPAPVLSRETALASTRERPRAKPIVVPPLPELAQPEEPALAEPSVERPADLVARVVAQEEEAEAEADDSLNEQDEQIDPPPDLATVPRDSPVWAWYAGQVVEGPASASASASWIHPKPDPADADAEADGEAPSAAISLDHVFGADPLLLREPGPIPTDASEGRGPRLVILTSLSLRPKPDTGGLALELAGAGTITVDVQPLGPTRLRLLVIDAGAVPSFLDARPADRRLEVVSVRRRERVVEVEVEHARELALTGVTPLANGARLEFTPTRDR